MEDGESDVFITPTLAHARAVADAGADIVAIDGTRRPRPDGLTLAETIAQLRETHDVLVMADCGSLDDAIAAEEAGADYLGTTLSGYTGERPKTAGPDLELIGLRSPRTADARSSPRDASTRPLMRPPRATRGRLRVRRHRHHPPADDHVLVRARAGRESLMEVIITTEEAIGRPGRR